jgi:hypothetical protein
VVHIVTTGV